MIDTAGLVAAIRLKSGLKNNLFYSDAQLAGFASDGGAELFDLLVKAREHYFRKTFDFTLVGGVGGNSVERPADFYKEQLLELHQGASVVNGVMVNENPYPVTITMLGDLSGKNQGGSFAPVLSNGIGGRQFILDGDQLIVNPAPSAAGTYRLWYTPILERLTLPNEVDLSVNYTPGAVNIQVAACKATATWPTGATPTSLGANEMEVQILDTNPAPLTFDGQSLVVGSAYLIPDSTNTINGIWIYNGLSDSGGITTYIFNRAPAFASGTTWNSMTARVGVTAGNVFGGTILVNQLLWHPNTDVSPWLLANDNPLNVDLITVAPLTGSWIYFTDTLLYTLSPDSADGLKIDGEEPTLGQLIWFAPGDAPLSATHMGPWRFDGLQDSSPVIYYSFSRPNEFVTGTVIPMDLHLSITDGVTMRGSTQVVPLPITVETTNNVDVFPLNFMTSAGVCILQNAEFDPSFVGGVLTIEGSPFGDRSYTIASYVDETQVTLTPLDGAALLNESFGAPTTIHVTQQGSRYTIPQEMAPWQDYLVIHASITVRQGRQQNWADLGAKLEQFKTRIAGMAVARTEDVQQAPITRHIRNRGGWGGSWGGW